MTTPESVPAHAGVPFPPPFIYAAGFLLGYLAQRRYPLPVVGAANTALVGIAGLTLVVLWVAVAGTAFMQFGRARTTIMPQRPATALVTGGIYRFTRNPMYISLVLLYVGLALLINSWWPLVLLPVVVVVIDRAVIAKEERYLASAFPTEYAAYRARVRRWL